MSGLDEFREQYRRAQEEFMTGDPEPTKQLWSRRDDVTLANPLGPPVRGWGAVRETMDRAAATIRHGEPRTYEVISSFETADLAYEVALQDGRMKLGDSASVVPVRLRATSIFRREDDGWKVVHRHADLTSQPRQS